MSDAVKIGRRFIAFVTHDTKLAKRITTKYVVCQLIEH